MLDSDADIGMWRNPRPVAANSTATGPDARSPIMANCAAPETMITDEKTASQGGNPARTASTP